VRRNERPKGFILMRFYGFLVESMYGLTPFGGMISIRMGIMKSCHRLT
jgi:hypothetical protein